VRQDKERRNQLFCRARSSQKEEKEKDKQKKEPKEPIRKRKETPASNPPLLKRQKTTD